MRRALSTHTVLAVHASACALLLPACAGYHKLDAGACGNGVVDRATEDCDGRLDPSLGGGLSCGAPGTARACRIECETTGDCPPGWGCSSGGMCDHGTPALKQQRGVIDLQPGAFEAGNVDDDGLPDLVVVQGTQVIVRFGQGDGRFGEEVDRDVNSVGPASLREIGGVVAAAIPTPTGVVVLKGSPDRTVGLSALAFAPANYLDPRSVPYRTLLPVPVELPKTYTQAPVDGCKGVLEIGPQDGSIEFSTFPIPYPLTPGPASVVPGRLATQQWFPFATLPPVDATSGTRVVVPLSNGVVVAEPELPFGNTGPRVAETVTQFADWTLAADAPVLTDGSRVVLSANDPAKTVLTAVLSDGKLDTPTVDHAFDACSTLGRPLAAADIDGDGLTDFVYGGGVCFASNSGAMTKRDLGTDWSEAAVGDFNGDGSLDIAGSSATGVDVEYWSCRDQTCDFQPGIPIDVGGKPRNLRAGSLDNFVVGTPADLAFVVDRDGTDLMVAFGSSSHGLGKPRTEATVNHLQHFEVGRFQFSADNCYGIDSIIASYATPDEGDGLLALVGDLTGFLYAPLAIADGAHALPAISPHLVALQKGDATQADVVTLANASGDPKLYASPDVLADTTSASTLESLPVPSPTGSLLCDAEDGHDGFTWTAGDIDGDGIDELVAIDGSTACPDATGTGEWFVVREVDGAATPAVHTAPNLGAARAALLHDLDHDGNVDLAVATTHAVEILWGPLEGSANPERDAFSMTSGATSLAVIQLDGDAQAELAVAGQNGVDLLDLDGPRTRHLTRLDKRLDASLPRLVRTADVNRDGVDDLLVAGAKGVSVWLGTSHLSAGE